MKNIFKEQKIHIACVGLLLVMLCLPAVIY